MTRPDWNKVMADCGGAHPRDNELVSITRGTAHLAASAIRTSQEEVAYHNFNHAEVELRDVLAQPDARTSQRAREIETMHGQNLRLRSSLQTIARCLAPGNRTFDELMRDAMLACDIARGALNAPPSPPGKPIVTDDMVNRALEAWFSGSQSETDQALERSMKRAIEAAFRAKCETCGGRGEIGGTLQDGSSQTDPCPDCRPVSLQDHGNPMETAPKTGEVLIQVEKRAGIPNCFLVGHYQPGGHCIDDHPPICEGWYFWNGCMFDRAAKPLRWWPLPAMVAEDAISEGKK